MQSKQKNSLNLCAPRLLWLLCITVVGCAPIEKTSSKWILTTAEYQEYKPEEPSHEPYVNLQVPNLVAIDKGYFWLVYEQTHRLARFVEYTVTSQQLQQAFVKRKNRYHSDLNLFHLKIPPVQPTDYRNTGYDRGHLAPSGDFEWSESANDATFTMANMAPQLPGLNRVAWRALEDQVRKWTCKEQRLRVVTGPVYGAHPKKLKSGVTVPRGFFKVVLDETSPKKAIGFVLYQDDSDYEIFRRRIKSVRSVEAEVGLNFFTDLSSAQQEKIENTADISVWSEARCQEATAPSIRKDVSLQLDYSAVCRMGELRPAAIQGCCSGHLGVMGPKKRRGCCDQKGRVFCNDGTLSRGCKCYN
jgi:endonuclease G, mitochondrial